MHLRTKNIDRLTDGTFDVLVIGGGINGAVSAACLAGRGGKVALIDRGDFAGFTSQQSSNLAWGGIKYMETFEFGLVRKLCVSRNELIRSFPSTVREIRFYTAHEKGFRHGLLKLVLGTWFYWLLGSFFTQVPRLLTKKQIRDEEPIIKLDGMDGGFEYSDAYLHDNDARFVWNFIRSAIDADATIANYVTSLGATRRDDGVWVVKARDEISGHTFDITARVLINACGPFVDENNEKANEPTTHRHVFSKGIHLIVRRLTPHARVLTFFADDGRLFFVIPMGPRTCIGTTDTRVDSPFAEVTADDRRFVLDNINKRLELSEPLTEDDVIAERCGVRPLVVSTNPKKAKKGNVDFLQLSRKHAVEVDRARAHISIFGGKLTDCLNVGEEVATFVQQLGIKLPRPKKRWFGEPADDVHARFLNEAFRIGLDAKTAPSASEPLTQRLWRRYGADAFAMLQAIERDPREGDLLIEGSEYLRVELEHAARREMITKLEDFLRRRSKIALVISRDDLRRAPGLREACAILFGDQADAKLAEYFGDIPATSVLPALSAAPVSSKRPSVAVREAVVARLPHPRPLSPPQKDAAERGGEAGKHR